MCWHSARIVGRPPRNHVELTVYIQRVVRKHLRERAVAEETTLSALVEKYVERGLRERRRAA